MQMDIISTYGNQDLVRTILENPNRAELKKLAHEFCASFNLKVTNNGLSESRVSVVDNNGIPLGALYTTSDDSDTIYIYEAEGIVKKERSSKYTDNNSRDSKKISTLIRSIKKNNEEPTASKLFPLWNRALNFGFTELKSSRASVNLAIPREQVQFMCEKLLGENVSGMIDQALLLTMLSMIRKEDKEIESQEVNLNRYAKGVTAIKIPVSGTEKHYIICKAKYNTTTNSVVDVTDAVRHESMSDTPFAGLALMCRSRKQDGRFTTSNEFGIERCDRYWEDLDVVTAYNGHCFFLLIPDHAE
jgi:hypothetical protein